MNSKTPSSHAWEKKREQRNTQKSTAQLNKRGRKRKKHRRTTNNTALKKLRVRRGEARQHSHAKKREQNTSE